MTPERIAEIKREFEWHRQQPITSATVTRLCQYGMELALENQELRETVAALRTPPMGTGGTE